MTKILALIKREPALVLGIICGAAVWALTRFLGYTPSAAEQAVYGIVPVVFAAVTRQFVTPATSAASGTESTLDEVWRLITHPSTIEQVAKQVAATLPTNVVTYTTPVTMTAAPTVSGALTVTPSNAESPPLPPLIPPDSPA